MDDAGNTSTCQFEVEAEDTTDPSISCPATTTAYYNASCLYSMEDLTGLATGLGDNCSDNVDLVLSQIPVLGTSIGVNATVELVVEDEANIRSSIVDMLELANHDVIEAADAYGTNSWQKLTKVQLPLALPAIFAGVNQTIMLSLSMVVIASMIGVKGLGQPVLKAIQNQYFAIGLLNGFAIVALAIIFDRVSQRYGMRIQRHRQGKSDV